MGKKGKFYRDFVGWLHIIIHLMAIVFYMYFGAGGTVIFTEEFSSSELKGNLKQYEQFTSRIIYTGYGFINSMFGLVTGIVLLLEPEEGFNVFLRVWISSALVILLASFGVQIILSSKAMQDSLAILLLSMLLYGFAFLVAKSSKEDDDQECGSTVNEESCESCEKMIVVEGF